MAEVRWNPWRDLRERGHIVFARRPLPAGLLGVYGRRGNRAAIVVDVDLDQQARNAVLAHELVHDERGGGIDAPYMPASWADVVVREERFVEREVARRLVPPAELDAFVERRRQLEEPVMVGDVVEEFDVPAWVAAEAVHRRRDELDAG